MKPTGVTVDAILENIKLLLITYRKVMRLESVMVVWAM
jgi:hypothetical protein